MHPTTRHRSAERAFRRLITDGEFAEPDEVEYTETTVVFLWHATKLAVVPTSRSRWPTLPRPCATLR
jgi:hypothetical protein